MKTAFRTAVGFVMLALGAVGLVLTIMPTTPFVLIAAACFAGSPALQARVMKIPFVNEYITNYRERKGISRLTLAVSLSFLWTTLTVSAIVISKLWAFIVLAVVGAVVTAHIIIMSKPLKDEDER